MQGQGRVGRVGGLCTTRTNFANRNLPFFQLLSLIRRLQPRAIIPTVNAAQRDEQVDRFVQHMDLTRDKSRIDAYLSPRGAVDPSRPYCEGSHSAKRGGKRPAQPLNVESVCVAEQRRLWELATMSRQMATDEGSGAAAAVGFFSRSKCEGSEDVNADALEQLKEMVGGPTDYLLSLLRDSHGSVELACSIHFGPNGGVVPDASSARAMMAHQGFGRRSPLCHGSTAQTGGESYEARHVRGAGCATSGVRKEHHDSENDHTDDVIIVGGNKDDDSDDGDDGDDVFPCGVVACVHGDDKAFNLFSGRELVEKRLQQLGAKLTRRKTKSTTHIITPCGVKVCQHDRLFFFADIRCCHCLSFVRSRTFFQAHVSLYMHSYHHISMFHLHRRSAPMCRISHPWRFSATKHGSSATCAVGRPKARLIHNDAARVRTGVPQGWTETGTGIHIREEMNA